MTLTDILKTTAARLKELWPDRKVRVDEIPMGANGTFFVGLTDTEQTQGLDKRQRRTAGVQVLYFRRDRDNLGYLAWAETMYDHFRHLEKDGRPVHLANRKARDDETGRFYQFLFDVNLNFVETEEPGETMEHLDMEESI